jgi:Fic family protein
VAPAISHHWHPIALPPDSAALEVQELRAFETMWRRERESLHEQRAVQDFNERMARWWSIETGIIERLYTLSDGITVQLVEKGFDVGLIPHGESNLSAEELVAILRDHRESLDFAMDIVSGQRPLTTRWIEELHALLTRNQETTEGFDSMGRRVEFPLLRGAWKIRPNNPLTRDGSVHEYCPPDQVASEMDRLIEFYQACPSFPEVRAAWLHHAFTQIHPFQDGNGRVARVLASIDFIKAGLFPLLVRRTERDRYIDALRVADTGDLAPLVRYFADVQQVLVRRAISEAEGAIDAKSGLSTVLAAAKKKRARRAEPAPAERQVLRGRLTALLDDAQRSWEETAVTIRKQLSDIDVRPAADENEEAQLHRFRTWLEAARNTALAQWTKFL